MHGEHDRYGIVVALERIVNFWIPLGLITTTSWSTTARRTGSTSSQTYWSMMRTIQRPEYPAREEYNKLRKSYVDSVDRCVVYHDTGCTPGRTGLILIAPNDSPSPPGLSPSLVPDGISQ